MLEFLWFAKREKPNFYPLRCCRARIKPEDQSMRIPLRTSQLLWHGGRRKGSTGRAS
jgi:hypothetical protein